MTRDEFHPRHGNRPTEARYRHDHERGPGYRGHLGLSRIFRDAPLSIDDLTRQSDPLTRLNLWSDRSGLIPWTETPEAVTTACRPFTLVTTYHRGHMSNAPEESASTVYRFMVMGKGKPQPVAVPEVQPGELLALPWGASDLDHITFKNADPLFQFLADPTYRLGLKPLSVYVTIEGDRNGTGREVGIVFGRNYTAEVWPPTNWEPTPWDGSFVLYTVTADGFTHSIIRPGKVPADVRPWLIALQTECATDRGVYDAGFGPRGTQADLEEIAERVAQAVASLLISDEEGGSEEEDALTAPRRGRGASIPRNDFFLMAAAEPARATVHGILTAHQSSPTIEGVVVRNAAGTDLNFRVTAENPSSADQLRQASQQLAQKLGPLSLKALYGSLLIWAEETGADAYDQYATITMSRIMRASQLRSNPNDDLMNAWFWAWMPLVQSWVQVPVYDWEKRKAGCKAPRSSTTYQRILASDQMTIVDGLIADEPQYNRPQIFDARVHPGEWLYNGLFSDKGRQFHKTATRLLQYDAGREHRLIRIGFYLGPLFNINRKRKAEGVLLSATQILDGAVVPYNKKDLGRVIPALTKDLQSLVKDGILGDAQIEDPGDSLPPRKRVEAFRVRVFDPNI